MRSLGYLLGGRPRKVDDFYDLTRGKHVNVKIQSLEGKNSFITAEESIFGYERHFVNLVLTHYEKCGEINRTFHRFCCGSSIPLLSGREENQARAEKANRILTEIIDGFQIMGAEIEGAEQRFTEPHYEQQLNQ